MPIKLNCVACGSEYSVKPSRLKRSHKPLYCSKACYAKKIAATGHPNRRNFLTAKCQWCSVTFEVRKQRDSKTRKFCTNACRGAWHSSLPYSEWRGKLSSSVAGRPRGHKNNRFGKPPVHPGKAIPYKTRDGQLIKFRSSWELATARYLDRRCIAWTYEPRRFDLGDTTYVPDFYLSNQNCFWEIKGWFHDKARAKIARFRELYPEERLVVITKSIFSMIANDASNQKTDILASARGPLASVSDKS